MRLKKGDKIAKMLVRYQELKEDSKEMKSLGDDIRDYIMVNGTKDEKGNYFIILPAEPIDIMFTAGLRTSVNIDQDLAYETLPQSVIDACEVQPEPYLDKALLDQEYDKGNFSKADMKKFSTLKETYALTFKAVKAPAKGSV